MLLEINSELVGTCILLFIMCVCLSYVIALGHASMKKKERKRLLFIVLLVATICMIVLEVSVKNFNDLCLGDFLVILTTYFFAETLFEFGNAFWFRYFLTKRKA